MKHEFDNGKYTVCFEDGRLSALRNGEPWDRDLVGDNMVLAMLSEVDRLMLENKSLKEADELQGAANWLAHAIVDLTVADLQSNLRIGYNRASRLYEVAIAQRVASNAQASCSVNN